MHTEFTAADLKLGRTYTTPIGELVLCGWGSNGMPGHEHYRLHAQFGDSSAAPVMHWSSDHGFETPAEIKTRHWNEGYEKLDNGARALIEKLFGERLAGDRSTLKSAADLVSVAKRRLVKEGKIALLTCGRCGGTGNYSYNQMDGTRCYGCGGSGKKLPTTAACLKVA